MARKAKGPRWYPSKGAFKVTINGDLHTLCKAEADTPEARLEAGRAYDRLLADLRSAKADDGATVAVVLGRYMDEIRATKTSNGIRLREFVLPPFIKRCGSIIVRDLQLTHVLDFINEMRQPRGPKNHVWTNGTVRNFQSVLKAGFNWLHNNDYISRNPVAKLKRVASGKRDAECVVTEEQHRLFISQVSPELADLLNALWWTGSRPGALCVAEARDLRGSTVYIEGREGIKKKAVTIYLNPRARELFHRLAEKHPAGPLFRNTQGEPWTMNAVRQSLIAVRKRCGAPLVTAYSWRHAYISRLVAAGEPIAQVATLCNTSPTYIERVYGHLSSQRGLLQSIADRY